jgi:hypothetical protein
VSELGDESGQPVDAYAAYIAARRARQPTTGSTPQSQSTRRGPQPISPAELERCYIAPKEPEAVPNSDASALALTAAEDRAVKGLSVWRGILFGAAVWLVAAPLAGLASLLLGPSVSIALGLLVAIWAAIVLTVLVLTGRVSKRERATCDEALATYDEALAASQAESAWTASSLRETYRSSLALATEAKTNLTNASRWLRSGEYEYSASAFAPFWDAVEQAALHLGEYDGKLRRLQQNAEQYYRSLHGRQHTFPEFPVTTSDVGDAPSVLLDFKRVTRLGQTNFHFANIGEHRLTRSVMIAGFRSLGQAVTNLSGTIDSSMAGLRRSVSSDIAEVVDEEIRSRELLDRRMREQNRMLDNIQRGRSPSAGDSPSI